MATTDAYLKYSLLELAKRTHNGDHIEIVNTLVEDNPILQHAPWQEANNIFGHVYTKVMSMPSGSWRAINQGVALEAATTRQLTENLAMLACVRDNVKIIAMIAHLQISGRIIILPFPIPANTSPTKCRPHSAPEAASSHGPCIDTV